MEHIKIKIVTDTDVIPRGYIASEPNDVYQLIYGIMVYSDDTATYNLLIELCNDYPLDIIKKARLKVWERVVKETIERIHDILKPIDQNMACQLVVPFMGIDDNINNILSHYEVALSMIRDLLSRVLIPLDYVKKVENRSVSLRLPELDYNTNTILAKDMQSSGQYKIAGLKYYFINYLFKSLYPVSWSGNRLGHYKELRAHVGKDAIDYEYKDKGQFVYSLFLNTQNPTSITDNEDENTDTIEEEAKESEDTDDINIDDSADKEHQLTTQFKDSLSRALVNEMSIRGILPDKEIERYLNTLRVDYSNKDDLDDNYDFFVNRSTKLYAKDKQQFIEDFQSYLSRIEVEREKREAKESKLREEKMTTEWNPGGINMNRLVGALFFLLEGDTRDFNAKYVERIVNYFLYGDSPRDMGNSTTINKYATRLCTARRQKKNISSFQGFEKFDTQEYLREILKSYGMEIPPMLQ